ncbi:MAG: hypothetical protein QME42_06820, partial [bacterium]|nr:hypothetical protein [bacterium]
KPIRKVGSPNRFETWNLVDGLRVFTQSDWYVICPDSTLVMEAIRGRRKHQLSFWDALIWASAKKARVQYLYSEDFQHKQIIEGVQFINPFVTDNDDIGRRKEK